MLQNRYHIAWTCLICVVFATTGWRLHADDQPATSDGYKIVPVTVGGRTIPVRVKEGGDPLQHASFPDELDPQRIFSATNPMANKTFVLPSEALSQNNSDFKNREQQTFITKSYTDDALSPTAPNLDAKPGLPTAGAYGRSATGFDRSYPTSSADAEQNRTDALASSTVSTEQNHTALLGGPEKSDMVASDSTANKQYLGPGAQHVPDDLAIKDNIVISRMSGLPNRPLSIDEVRNLINHETKPNTEAKPEEPSKPLNDPGYKPEPLRDTLSPSDGDDQNDPVPPPGTMAAPPAPENSEPLPQP